MHVTQIASTLTRYQCLAIISMTTDVSFLIRRCRGARLSTASSSAYATRWDISILCTQYHTLVVSVFFFFSLFQLHELFWMVYFFSTWIPRCITRCARWIVAAEVPVKGANALRWVNISENVPGRQGNVISNGGHQRFANVGFEVIQFWIWHEYDDR